MLYNRKARDYHLAKLDAADSQYWSQIADGASAMDLMRRTFQIPKGDWLCWNDYVAWKRRSINFRTVRVGMAMQALNDAKRLGNKRAIQDAKRQLRGLRVCPNTACYMFGHSLQDEICSRCGTELSGGGDEASLSVSVEPRAIVQRLCTLQEYQTAQYVGSRASFHLRPRGVEVAIAETDNLAGDLALLLALRGIATPTRKLLGGYQL